MFGSDGSSQPIDTQSKLLLCPRFPVETDKAHCKGWLDQQGSLATELRILSESIITAR